MRVLWLATSPSLYKEEKVMGWIGSLEHIVKEYCPDIELGITFEYPDTEFKVEKNHVTYYPINLHLSVIDVLRMKFNGNDNWFRKRPLLKKVIDDFKPDIIQCFGSEWNWGLIAQNINIPVVVHMQGFINIYNDSLGKVQKKPRSWVFNVLHPRSYIQRIFLKHYDRKRNVTELEIMKSCSFFMGRTEWDKNIVKYLSPGSRYYYCPEAIRPIIYDSPVKWTYKRSESINIVTIASAGNLKGNGIILETAKILKDMGINFNWRVSGDKGIFANYEYSTGIMATDVNVELLGFIDALTIKRELLEAEMFVLPSIMDNSPNSLCEAQLIGTPVIASYVGGIPQMVENHVTGELYPYNEPYALAFMILNLHNSPNKLIELSQNAITMAHQRHNPRRLAMRLEEVYSDVVSLSKSTH